ncbi:MAG: aminotransferase class V-fold PLP-dependent enzyme [Rhodobacterales bacterium]|nr:aminotransferase class V-fold PLP-dependent enzyme [Rhodobacterales bacterium]NCT11433.1 aminotransferase class V-fold PLP-dependent enzyme [Rhodobacterales bacterium]
MSRVYLDHNASAPLRPEARAAMLAALDVAGNPSSVHAEGRAARALVEAARAEVAAAVGCTPVEVVFTSGATEAASVLARLPGRVEVEPTAHDALWAQRREGEGAGSYAMGLANGETGLIAALPEGRAGLLLLDLTQALGRVPFSFAWSGADLAVLSAHKLGGPKGVGALIVRDGLDIASLLPGGGQESGRRSGTENVIGIAGFGAAATAALRDQADGVWARVAELRNILETGVEAASPETIFVGKGGLRLPNTTCFATPEWKGETQVMAMDLAGFAISAGSACSSGKVRESRVLRAMGFGADVAGSAVRVSLGPQTREDEVLRFVQAWVERRARQRARAA